MSTQVHETTREKDEAERERLIKLKAVEYMDEIASFRSFIEDLAYTPSELKKVWEAFNDCEQLESAMQASFSDWCNVKAASEVA